VDQGGFNIGGEKNKMEDDAMAWKEAERRRVRLGRNEVWVKNKWWRSDEGRKEMIDREGRSWKKIRGKKKRREEASLDGAGGRREGTVGPIPRGIMPLSHHIPSDIIPPSDVIPLLTLYPLLTSRGFSTFLGAPELEPALYSY